MKIQTLGAGDADASDEDVRGSRAKPSYVRANLAALAAVGLTIVLWASAFPGIRAGLRGYSPAHVGLLRYVVASVVLAVYALATRMPLPHWRDVPGIALTGLLGITLYNVTLNSGEVSVTSGIASFIVASAPVFVALEATAFLGERLRVVGWLGIILSFAGVAVIGLGTDGGLHLNPYALLVLAAAILQSLYFVGQKPFLRRYSPVQYTSYAIWAGTFFLLVFSPGIGQQVQVAPLSATLAVVYLGVFPGALAYVSWAFALSRLPTSIAGSFLYLVPILATGIAWVWLGEFVPPIALVGGAIVLAGVILLTLHAG